MSCILDSRLGRAVWLDSSKTRDGESDGYSRNLPDVQKVEKSTKAAGEIGVCLVVASMPEYPLTTPKHCQLQEAAPGP